MPHPTRTHAEVARVLADVIHTSNPNVDTLDRLACEIRIANSTHEHALLDPRRDPDVMLSAAIAVSFALHGIVDTKQVMVTRYSASAGVVTLASLSITPDAAGCAAERRLHVAPVPLLAAYVWVPVEHGADARDALRGLAGVLAVTLFPACGFLQVELDAALFEVEA